MARRLELVTQPDSIRHVVSRTDPELVPERLVDLVPLASGALPDDVGIVPGHHRARVRATGSKRYEEADG